MIQMIQSESCTVKQRNRESGIALVGVLAVVVPLVVISGASLSVLVSNHRELELQIQMEAARQLSASGAHHALARLNTDPAFEGEYQVTLGGSTAAVSVLDWESDGVDNDGDGQVDNQTEDNILSIRSAGHLNADLDGNGNPVNQQGAGASQRSDTEVLVRRLEFDVVLEQSVYIDDPLATLDINGNAFMITGHDTNADGSAGSEPSVPAIGVPGDPDNIIDQISAQQEDNIVGAGGLPSVLEVAEVDLEAFINSLIPAATIIWTGASEKFTGGSIGNRDDLSQMEIAYAHGDLEISGNTTGSGVLIVEGDLKVTGAFDYAGLILSKGAVTFRGGGGAKDLCGALVCLGAFEAVDIEISGTIQIMYSSQVIAAAQSAVAAGFEVVSWIQE